jgi:hypothetical protein
MHGSLFSSSTHGEGGIAEVLFALFAGKEDGSPFTLSA